MVFILSERKGPVAVLTFNNPDQLNSATFEDLVEVNNALEDALADEQVRSVVLTGSGRGFCAGARIGPDVFAVGEAAGTEMRRSVNLLIENMRTSSKPIVTAVNGPAAGAGLGIALAGDIVLAARSARFVLSFAKLGAVLDAGASLLVQRAIGGPRARAMALLGEPVSAEKAAEWGMVWKCVDDASLMDEAMAVAQRLADGPPKALAWIKEQCEAGWTAPLAQVLELEAQLQSRAFATEDLREGAAAFAERRDPRFRGR